MPADPQRQTGAMPECKAVQLTPSISDFDPNFTAAVDLTKAEVWAVGAVCFDLLGERAPYTEADSTSLPLGPAVSPLTQAVVKRMLCWRSLDRFSALDAAAWGV